MVGTKHKKPLVLNIGLTLVAASYVLLVPTFLFAGLGVGSKAWLWGRLAAASYIVSWILLIAGILVAGPDAVRSGRRWVVGMFRRKAPLS